MTPGILTSLARTAGQLVTTTLIAWLVSLGVPIPDGLDERLQLLIAGAIMLGVVTAVRWLETRQGATGWPVLARRFARVLMLGAGSNRPVYVPPDRTVRATSDLMGTRVLPARLARE